ncbi:hypothetical protein [Agrococcus sp. ARC_14]|uniref:hypothetical protein n=1 Tax=Agrococcus sp. ARC_14 TaxID=2919927 RepID=UPI001F05526A|nr:hypothetical protein [Agrococcus sp. ARC_14]MCH1882079.1 hypothetical protein [Agrococcus sp. ARC_14]
MPDVSIDFQTLNQIAGSLKNLSVDLAAATTWEGSIAEATGKVWDDTASVFVQTAVEDMIGDWDYVRSVMALQAMQAAQKADLIGAEYGSWDFGAGTPGVTALGAGSWESAGGQA